MAKKMAALKAFEANMADAQHLVLVAKAFTNVRQNRMRAELRHKVGVALALPQRDHGLLDCLQSDQVFLTFLPGSELQRQDFGDARPFLRQALVAAAAAAETYIYDRAMERVGRLIASPEPPKRLLDIPTDVRKVLNMLDYARAGYGIRVLMLEPFIKEHASTAPSQVGEMLSLMGVSDGLRKVDAHLRVARGETFQFLTRFTVRRNKIAHQGDREGRKRALLTVAEVERDLGLIDSVIRAVEFVTEPGHTLRRARRGAAKNVTQKKAAHGRVPAGVALPAIEVRPAQEETGAAIDSTPPELSSPDTATELSSPDTATEPVAGETTVKTQ